jgi:uncharacterized protein YjiS (DUF1127 family)
MTKTSLNADPVVSDGLAANDDKYNPGNREKPVLTVLDGREIHYLDYALAVQRAKKLQAQAYAQAFSTLGRGIQRFLTVIVPSLTRPMWSRLKTSRQRRITVADLSRLSPEILVDIGLTDGDISAVSSGRIKPHELNEIRRSGWPY